MLDEIALGSQINVKVVKTPTRVAAAKTLVRVLSRSPAAREELKRQHRVRQTHFRRVPRGGRGYPIYVVKQRPLRGAVGESGTVTATASVLHDLRSVASFIEVSAA